MPKEPSKSCAVNRKIAMSEKVDAIELQDPENISSEETINDFNLELIKDISTEVEIRLGTAELTVEKLFSLKHGDVVTLNEELTEPVQVILNDNVIALGELVAVGDKFGLKITSVN